MKLITSMIAFLFVLFYLPSSLMANTAQFEKALSQFNEGNFEQAIQGFESLTRIEPNNKAVHYNLATAYEANQQIADAIYHYYKALRLDPDWEAPANNLKLIQPDANDQDENTTSYIFSKIFRESSSFLWIALFQAAVIILCIMLFVYSKVVAKQTDKMPSITVLSIFILGVIATVGVLEAHQSIQDLGVDAIVMEETVARQGAGNQYFEAVDLDAGTAITIEDVPENGWVKIRILNGTVGHIPVESIKAL